MIYLDNNATTQIDPRVADAMMPYILEYYGNPSSKYYTLAEKSEKAIEEAREKVADLVNAHSKEIIFTSSGTESNNFIIKGVSDYYKNYLKKGNHIITTSVEHDSIINSCKYLNGEIYMNKVKKKFKKDSHMKIDRGYLVDFLDVDKYGLVNKDIIKDHIKDTTILGSFIWANNETGNINDIKSISEIFYENNILIHSDATQIVGKKYVDVKDVNLDFMTFSSHKIYGPKGIAAVYLKKDGYKSPDITALLHGGDNQEFGYRGGTLAVHDIVGFGEAAYIAKKELDKNMEKISILENELRNILIEKYEDIIFITDESDHVPGVISFVLPDINNMLYIKKISDKVALSSGSACSITDKSHVLSAMGLESQASNFIRISLSKFNNKDEVEQLKLLL